MDAIAQENRFIHAVMEDTILHSSVPLVDTLQSHYRSHGHHLVGCHDNPLSACHHDNLCCHAALYNTGSLQLKIIVVSVNKSSISCTVLLSWHSSQCYDGPNIAFMFCHNHLLLELLLLLLLLWISKGVNILMMLAVMTWQREEKEGLVCFGYYPW